MWPTAEPDPAWPVEAKGSTRINSFPAINFAACNFNQGSNLHVLLGEAGQAAECSRWAQVDGGSSGAGVGRRVSRPPWRLHGRSGVARRSMPFSSPGSSNTTTAAESWFAGSRRAQGRPSTRQVKPSHNPNLNRTSIVRGGNSIHTVLARTTVAPHRRGDRRRQSFLQRNCDASQVHRRSVRAAQVRQSTCSAIAPLEDAEVRLVYVAVGVEGRQARTPSGTVRQRGRQRSVPPTPNGIGRRRGTRRNRVRMTTSGLLCDDDCGCRMRVAIVVKRI